MGKIRNTADTINDLVGNVASDSWYNFIDVIEDAKEEAREQARAEVLDYLESKDIDLDDWEEIMGETLDDYIDEHIYAEWDV